MLDNNSSLKDVIDAFALIDSKLVDRGGARTITPSTSNQVLSKGNYKGDITIKGDTNLVASNIKKGVSLFGVTGTLNEGIKSVRGTATGSSTTKLFTFADDSKSSNFYYVPIYVPFKPSSLICIVKWDNAIYQATLNNLSDVPVVYVGTFSMGRVSSTNFTFKADSSVIVDNNNIHLPIQSNPISINVEISWVAFE